MQKVQALLHHSTHKHCRKQIIALTGSKKEMQEAQTKALLPVNYFSTCLVIEGNKAGVASKYSLFSAYERKKSTGQGNGRASRCSELAASI